MEVINHSKFNRWVLVVLMIHSLILLLLSMLLPALPNNDLQVFLYQFITEHLYITTQKDVSSFPFVAVLTSAYSLFASVILFTLFLLGLKKLVQPPFNLHAALYDRFRDQLPMLEDINFKSVLKTFLIALGGLLLLVFHLFWFNTGITGGKGDLYPYAFQSRWGIFIVQSIMCFWAIGVWTSFLFFWLLTEIWVTRSNVNK